MRLAGQASCCIRPIYCICNPRNTLVPIILLPCPLVRTLTTQPALLPQHAVAQQRRRNMAQWPCHHSFQHRGLPSTVVALAPLSPLGRIYQALCAAVVALVPPFIVMIHTHTLALMPIGGRVQASLLLRFAGQYRGIPDSIHGSPTFRRRSQLPHPGPQVHNSRSMDSRTEFPKG